MGYLAAPAHVTASITLLDNTFGAPLKPAVGLSGITKQSRALSSEPFLFAALKITLRSLRLCGESFLSSARRALSSVRCALRPVLWFALLTPAVLLIHGYHPFAEDAAIYVAAVRKLADSSLYQPDAPFVLASTHLSLFAHLGAAMLRVTRIPLEYLLLLTHLACTLAFLLACRSLARRIFASPAAHWSAVILGVGLFSLPLAGTSLMLMDPYVTARSFTTALSLFALSAAIDRRWTRTALLLLLTAVMHPLMTLYAAAFVVLFILIDLEHARVAATLAAFGVIACGTIYLPTLHTPVSPAWRQAVLSRRYLFPSEWAWFEYLGLAVPLLMYALALRRLGAHNVAGKLCLTAILLGTSSALAALLFIHPSTPDLLVRLQLLRAYLPVYLVGIVLLGGLIGHQLWTRSSRRWAACTILAVTGFAMFLASRLTYPASDHIELPHANHRNPWQQAFLWIRANTPRDAVFAANPDLVLLRGEDAQGFRVMTGRSLLADQKDEGVAVVFPELAPRWGIEYNSQKGIDQLSDAERLARLRPLGVTWLLLSRSAPTSFPCPWHNSVAQVCRLVPAQK
jgi:hypothetical protein